MPPPAERAICGAVEEASVRRYPGVLVPKPVQLFRKMLFDSVEEAIKLLTVKLFDVVAIKEVPLELEVMIEFPANEVTFVPPFATPRVPLTPDTSGT